MSIQEELVKIVNRMTETFPHAKEWFVPNLPPAYADGLDRLNDAVKELSVVSSLWPDTLLDAMFEKNDHLTALTTIPQKYVVDKDGYNKAIQIVIDLTELGVRVQRQDREKSRPLLKVIVSYLNTVAAVEENTQEYPNNAAIHEAMLLAAQAIEGDYENLPRGLDILTATVTETTVDEDMLKKIAGVAEQINNLPSNQDV